MSASSNDSPLQGLRRYAVKRKIGSGGMASVYLAHDRTLGRDVAIKLLHEHLMQSPESVRRFTTEARAVASLSHENVIRIFDFGDIESRPYLVMEFIDGPTLASLIERFGPLPNLAAAEAAKQVALGLSCAHATGVFHRDIKPDNIMIDEGGCVKIMDFGIAYLVNKESLTLTGSFVGSPRYISPEQADGTSALSGKTDIFSLGVVLYLALSGNLPFDAETPAGAIHAIINATPPSLYKNNNRVLFWLSDLAETFLEKDTARRPDAPAAVSRIDEECCRYGLTLGKKRLKAYIGDPDGYRSREDCEIFEHYRARALEEANRKRIAAALKMMEQAKQFGTIGAADRKIIDACMRRRFLRKLAFYASAGLVVCCATAGAIRLTVINMEKRGIRSQSNVVPVSEAPPTRNTNPDTLVPAADSGAASAGETVPLVPAAAAAPQNEPAATKQRALKAVPKPMEQGFLSIKTNPPWAKVYIDDIERGMTPTRVIYRVPQGSHEIRIVKGGFAEYRKTVVLSTADTIPLRIQLRPEAASNQ